MNTLGERVKDFRKYHGWSMDKLAKKADISKSYVYEIEHDRTTNGPSAYIVHRLSCLFNTTVEYLLEGDRVFRESEFSLMRDYDQLNKDDKLFVKKIIEKLGD